MSQPALLGQPKQRWGAAVAAPVVVGLIVVLAMFGRVQQWEKQRMDAELQRQAATLAHALSERFAQNAELAQAAASLFRISDTLDRRTFDAYADDFLRRHPEIRAVSWAKFVTDAERAAFEARGRADGWPDFAIRQ